MKTFLTTISQGLAVLSFLAVNSIALITALNITEQAKRIDNCYYDGQEKARCFQDVAWALIKDVESESFTRSLHELLDVENKVSDTLSSQPSFRLRMLMQDLLKLASSIRHFRFAVSLYLHFLKSSTMEAGIQRRADIIRICDSTESSPEVGLNEMYDSVMQFVGRKESKENEGNSPYRTTWAKHEVILLPKLLAFASNASEALLENAFACWALNEKKKEYVEWLGLHLWGIRGNLVGNLIAPTKELDEDIKAEIKLFTDLMQE